jgi:hypothetical protein
MASSGETQQENGGVKGKSMHPSYRYQPTRDQSTQEKTPLTTKQTQLKSLKKKHPKAPKKQAVETKA